MTRYKDMLVTNNIFDIDDLIDLSDQQKAEVLVWFARKVWVMLEEGSGEPDYYGKSYDPMEIEIYNGERIAHSYVFDMADGGRHHEFKDFAHLESMIQKEAIEKIRNMIKSS